MNLFKKFPDINPNGNLMIIKHRQVPNLSFS